VFGNPAPAGRNVYSYAADFPSFVRSDIWQMSLLMELKNKSTLYAINIALLTELKAARFGQTTQLLGL
jgi:hypothetical protein